MDVTIRRFTEADAGPVRELFARINRLLAPPEQRAAFEAYIARSITEEIGRIEDYYAEHGGAFFVAEDAGQIAGIAGMFGLERVSPQAMELRRMYVAPELRRRGIAGAMLTFAEEECARRGFTTLELSTSELQREALAFYRQAGYVLEREEVAAAASNKTIGGGIRRFYFSKTL
ncbi:MAG TPA: GNAT family N-acetyltransferase [Pseudolabrys sp.]|nr:GNAT family N-acetyltransferase [Pseudolabrys sp.]